MDVSVGHSTWPLRMNQAGEVSRCQSSLGATLSITAKKEKVGLRMIKGGLASPVVIHKKVWRYTNTHYNYYYIY